MNDKTQYLVQPLTTTERRATGFAWEVHTLSGRVVGRVANLREVDALLARVAS